MRRLPRPHVPTFQAASLGTGFVSAFLLAWGSFSVTPTMIAELARTKWDYANVVASALAEQAAVGRAGFFLLVLSVVFSARDVEA